MRFLMPFALRKMAQKVMKDAEGSPFSTFQGTTYEYGNRNTRNKSQSEGEVSVDYIPPKENPKRRNSSAGEFIDFEEVK